jgi:hypothetical protein
MTRHLVLSFRTAVARAASPATSPLDGVDR